MGRSDALFHRFDKPKLVMEAAGEHLGSDLMGRTVRTGGDASELIFEFRGEPDFHIASVTRADGTSSDTNVTRAFIDPLPRRATTETALACVTRH